MDNLTVREGTLDGNPVNQYFFGDYMVGSVPVPEATPTPEPSVEEVAEKIWKIRKMGNRQIFQNQQIKKYRNPERRQKPLGKFFNCEKYY